MKPLWTGREMFFDIFSLKSHETAMKQPKYSFILHRVRPVASVMGYALKEGNSKEGNPKEGNSKEGNSIEGNSIEGNSLHRVRPGSGS